MSKRTALFVAIAAIAALAGLALSGCGAQDMDEETRKSTGLAIGILIIAASGLGYFIQGRYFNGKRKQAAQRKRQRSKKKRR